MLMLDIQNFQLSHDNFDISINDLNLGNDVWYIETSINLYFNFSYKVLQQATHNPIINNIQGVHFIFRTMCIKYIYYRFSLAQFCIC